MSVLIYGALLLWPIVHLLRRMLGKVSQTSPRQRQSLRAGKQAFRALPVGALVGALACPTAGYVLSALFHQGELVWRHQPLDATAFVEGLQMGLFVLVLASPLWSIGILLVLPLWSFLSGFWKLGPLAACGLGAGAACSVAIYCWSTIPFSFLTAPLNAYVAAPHLEHVGVLWMGLAGASSGVTVWWVGGQWDGTTKFARSDSP